MGFLDRRVGSFVKRPTQFNRGQSITIPAPYGGINLRDAITALKPFEARVLENWFPDSGKLSLRAGFEGFATGVGSGTVKTLATMHGLTADKLIAAANGHLYNASSAGAAVSLSTGQTEDSWQTANFNGGGGGKLFLVNGADAPRDWDGTTLASTAWTGSGLTITNLVNVANVRNRLWFCENGKADVWYGGIGSVTGTLTKFQLSQITSGGFCMAVGSWSRDAGDGSDDVIVFIMNTGQVLIYQGDPATTFELVGRFDTGAPPIGRQCMFKVGGELVIITRLGLLPVSAAMGFGLNMTGGLDLSALNPWGKIAPMIVSDAESYGSNVGWAGTSHNGVIYITVPIIDGLASKNIVLNTRTGAWTVFRGWNARTLASYNNGLYIGAMTGGLVNVQGGRDDGGADIVTVARGAFVTPEKSAKSQLFTAIRLQMISRGNVSGFLGIDTDYFDGPIVGSSVELSGAIVTTPWGSPWSSPWGSHAEPLDKWFSTVGDGRSVAPRVQAFANDVDMTWTATDLLFLPGSIK